MPTLMIDIRWCDRYLFRTTKIDNFGLLYVKTIFCTTSDDMTMNNVWPTLFTCAVGRAIISDLVLGLDTYSFIKCFRRFASRRRGPNFAVWYGGKNFVSMGTQ